MTPRGHCRRFPAQIVVLQNGTSITPQFPAMLAGGWCGEFHVGKGPAYVEIPAAEPQPPSDNNAISLNEQKK